MGESNGGIVEPRDHGNQVDGELVWYYIDNR